MPEPLTAPEQSFPHESERNASTPTGAARDAAAASRVRRVLLAELNFDGTTGGSHQVLYDTAMHLDRSRFEPVVLFYQENRFSHALSAAGIAVHNWDTIVANEQRLLKGRAKWKKAYAMAMAIVRRARFLRQQRIAIVHLNNSPIVGGDEWLPAARAIGAACVSYVAGVVPSGRLQHFVARHFDHLMPCSRDVATRMAQGGLVNEHVTVVHPAIDLPRFHARVRQPAAEVRRSLGIAPETCLVVMVGNVRRWKGQHVVVEALARMAPALRPRLHVAFAGAVRPEDEPYHRELVDAMKAAGVTANGTFLGARLDVPDLINAAAATVHASVEPEPFGIVVLEGMALGKVVMAADSGGPREILAGDAGYLHDPTDPAQLARGFERLVTDEAWCERLRTRARERVHAFDAPVMVRAVQAVYDDVLRRRA